MMSLRQFVKEFQNALGQAQGGAAIQLGKGQCASFEEYKSKVGFIKGLESAGTMAEQMLRQIEDVERNNDLPTMPPVPKGGDKK